MLKSHDTLFLSALSTQAYEAVTSEDGGLVVAVDTTVDEDMMQELRASTLTSIVQKMRKTAVCVCLCVYVFKRFWIPTFHLIFLDEITGVSRGRRGRNFL